MNGAHILETYCEQLADEVLDLRGYPPRFDPLDIDPWLAMSLMQKAVRRGREDLALGAAATLLRDSPSRLWRRLCVAAYEDVGVADFDAVGLVTAALKSKTWRAGVGGEWPVAAYLVRRLAWSVKCRAADDLPFVSERHPDFEKSRLDLTFRTVPELVDLATGSSVLPEQALALWYAVGTDRCRSSILRERRGDPDAVFDALCERGYCDSVVEVCREGLRKSGEVLAPHLILLWHEAREAELPVEPDNLPDEELIRGIPCWAYDKHVRPGNLAMARLLETGCETARWVAGHVPGGSRVRFLGEMLFRVESGLVDRRLRWEAGDRLRRMADLECYRVSPEDAAEVQYLLRRDLPLLNRERRHVA